MLFRILLIATSVSLLTAAIALAGPGGTGPLPDGRVPSMGNDLVFGGRSAAAAKVVVDTVVVMGPWSSGAPYNGQFETPYGAPAWNGWTSHDRTGRDVSHWQVSPYQAVSGSLSAWCGDLAFASCGPDDPEGGYGNYWHEILEWRGAVADPLQACTVSVDALVAYDSEPGYDYSHVSLLMSGGTVDLWSADGQGSTAVSVQGTYLAPDYLDGEVVVRFRFLSDGAWSDEDCYFPSAGAFRIDDVVINLDNGTGTSHDFEDGTLGPFAIAFPVGVGNFAQIWTGLQVTPGFLPDYSPAVAFIDDGLVVPGTGGTQCITWCYGPGGYIVNNSGGLAGPTKQLDNVIESPIMAWPEPSNEGAEMAFDVWRHETLSSTSPGIFFTWSVRSTADPDSTALANAPWRNRNLLFYGGPDWLRQVNPVGDLVVPGARWVQVQLGVVDRGSNWGFFGTDGTPAPYFDNVRVTSFPYYGPALSATVTHLPHDNFPASGQVDLVNPGTNSIRFDMGQPQDLYNGGTAPGDSIVISVVPQRAGAVLDGPPRLHWHLKRNALFDAWRSAGLPDVGVVDGWQIMNNGFPVNGKFAFDLPDTGFLFPGDFLTYYFEATDIAGGEAQTVTLPADTTGFSDFTDPMAYPPIYKLHALPSVWEVPAAPGTYAQPPILFWDDAGAIGNRDEWYMAFANLGLQAGVDYDIYYTNNPSVPAGHGLGGRATPAQIAGYDAMIYTSGVQASNTLAGPETGNGIDGGDDVGLLTAWLQSGDKNLLLTGDDLAGDLARGDPGQLAFLTDWMGVDLADENVLALLGPNTAPQVSVLFPQPVFANVSAWIGVASNFSVSAGYYGGGSLVTGIKRYDGVVPRAGAQRLAEFLDPQGNPGAYAFSAATLHDRTDVNSRLISFPYDFQSIWTPTGSSVKVSAPLPARVMVLSDILDYFGHHPMGFSDVPDAAAFATSHFPNPFNPSVTIAYTMPRTGHLTVKVYDVRGRLVRDLVDGRREAGPGKVGWDGRDDHGQAAAAGVYFYEARTGEEKTIGKMALIK